MVTYTVATHLDDDEILEAKVLAARAGERGLGAWVTKLIRAELAKVKP